MTEKKIETDDKKEIALEARDTDGARLFSPSAARNREPLRDAFGKHMPTSGKILEVGSGTGEHAVCFARAFPDLAWAPGDPDPASRDSIAAWCAHEGLDNIAPPHALNVAADNWESKVTGPFDGVASINMIHIAPFEAAAGLIRGAGALLRSGGKLFLYGPFSRNGAHSAPSNADFNESLKSRDPRWGVRDLERDIIPLAQAAGLSLEATTAMPANNLTVIFRRD